MEVVSLRARQKGETRTRILDCARDLFEKEGFTHARTPEMAAAAGVSHGSIFAHFKTRDELISAVIAAFASEADLEVRRCLKKAGTLPDVLRAHLKALRRYELLYSRILAERHLLPPKSKALVVELHSAIASQVLEAIESEAPSAKGPLKPHFAFNTWMALLTYYLLNADLFSPKRSVLETREGELIENYLKLIRKKGT